MNTETIDQPAATTQRNRAHHELKIWPAYFASLDSGERTAEIRPNNRDFLKNDFVTFREWDPETGIYSGRKIDRVITYVFNGPFYAGHGIAAIPTGYAILSLSEPPRPSYDCLAKLAPGEPYFVLRGQDRLASDLVREWATFAEMEGAPMAKVNDARRIAGEMEIWPNRKNPD